MVNNTQAPEKRESALKGKVQSVTNTKFPVYCSNRGSAGSSEEVTTPATERQVELLKGGSENGRGEGERETFTKTPGTGLVKETIPAGAQKVDMRAPRESGGEDTPNGGRFGGANTKGEAPANTPGMHGIEGHLKVSLGGGEHDEVVSIELADVTEGVRGNKGDTRDSGAKSDSETVDEQIEKKGERTLPCAMPESTQGKDTEPPRRTWDKVPQRKLARRCQRRPVTPKSKRRTRVASTQQESKAFLMSMNATKVCSWRRRRKESTRLKAIASAPQRKPPWEGSSCGRMWGAMRASSARKV